MNTAIRNFSNFSNFTLSAGLLAAALLGACASYDGSSLLAGKSTAAEVEATMGVPKDKVAGNDGETVWFYPRGPAARQTFAARIGGDGVLRAIEQRLTPANVEKMLVDRTTAPDARALLGPPGIALYYPRIKRDI